MSDPQTLTQSQAESRLTSNDISASSSGNCTTRSDPTCTSYEGMRSETADGIIGLKNDSGASSFVITGGTEVDHAGGEYSHGSGYKVDIRHESALDNHIQSTFTQMPDRGDGYPQWKDTSGNIYCDEGNHWDVTYR